MFWLRCTSPKLASKGGSLTPKPGRGCQRDFGHKTLLADAGVGRQPLTGADNHEPRGCSGLAGAATNDVLLFTRSASSPPATENDVVISSSSVCEITSLILAKPLGSSVFHQLHRRLRPKLPVT